VACAVFAVALNTTIATIAFPFVFLFGNPIGLVTLVSLGGFLVGKRFTTGKKIREKGMNHEKATPDVYTLGRFAFSVKLLALYLYTALVPMKLLFFRSFGARYRIDKKVQIKMDAFDGWFFASVGLILAWIVIGFVTGKLFWAMWFLVMLAAFCQIKMLGQVFAERYMYPATVGLCAILALLPEPAFWALVGAYVMRTHIFIPAWENNKKLYENGIAQDDQEPSNFCNMGDWYLMIERDLTLAGYYIQRNMQLDPDDYKPYINFASLWRILKDYPKALHFVKIAKEKATGCAGKYIHDVIDRQIVWISRELEGKPAEEPHVEKK
jgi:hypothetical protein